MEDKPFYNTIGIMLKNLIVNRRRTCILVPIIGVIFSLYCFLLLSDVDSEQNLQRAVTQSRRTAVVTAVERASPAVVNISAIKTVSEYTLFDEMLFFGVPRSLRERSLREVGSGVIISEEGHILTNHHVVEQAEKIRVTIADGREFDADIVGYDFLSDLALLKVDKEENLPKIQWGNSDNLLIGEWSLAIGNPFGLSVGNAQPTVTIGIVSATQRSLTVDNRFYEALIQTDASVNPGNSGGALVNVHGELIGINTVIRSTSGGSQGVGFAIPANKARKVIERIIKDGCVVPPYLGVEIQSVTEEMAEKLFGREASQTSTFSRGVLVSELERRSPFGAAGIKRGDIISIISGHRIKNKNDFKAVVRLLPLNEPILCKYVRRGKMREATLKLKALEWEYSPRRWGFTLTQPDKDKARKYKHRGVIISGVDKESGLSGSLKKGDVIYRINDFFIPTLEVFKIVDEEIRAPRSIQLFFERNGEERYIYVEFDRNNRRR